MRRHGTLVEGILLAASIAGMLPAALHAADLQVTLVEPPRNSAAAPTTAVTIEFDKPVDPASITPGSFRVFGRASGAKTGTLSFANSNRRMTFQPGEPFSAGETVRVNLSRGVTAADLTTLRGAGYFFQFQIRTRPSGTFEQIDVISNRMGDPQTRIYGAAATDLNNDGHVDLATVNEVSADVRVCLNRADGSALFQPFLTPVPISEEASPNDPADFDNDGNTDLCVAATNTNSVWVLLGAGDGTFSSTQEIQVGDLPHAIAALDVDGDGDADIANACVGSGSIALLINDGAGVFSAPTFFDGGVNGEYGLAAADMNNDGIADLVVGGYNGQQIRVQLGNGNGTFTPAGPAQSCGGNVWVVVVDDVNGDGNLDASVANDGANNGAVLLGDGAGAFGAPAIYATGSHTPSTDLGDLDGDGDADLVLSVFTGGFWRYYRNNGAGVFTFAQDFDAPSNPSCAVLFDADNDGDLDMALTDEIADVIVMMRNAGAVGVEPAGGADAAPVSNAPNPFRDGTWVRFALAAPGEVRLDVFDIRGRRVATDRSHRAAGSHELRFEGRDDTGHPLPTGVYLYRVVAGSTIGTGRMVLAR